MNISTIIPKTNKNNEKSNVRQIDTGQIIQLNLLDFARAPTVQREGSNLASAPAHCPISKKKNVKLFS
jgi:hypothetical protein